MVHFKDFFIFVYYLLKKENILLLLFPLKYSIDTLYNTTGTLKGIRR